MPNHSSCGRSSARQKRISTSPTIAARRSATGPWTSCSMGRLHVTRMARLDQPQIPTEQRLVDCAPGVLVRFGAAQKVEGPRAVARNRILNGVRYHELAGTVAGKCRVESAEIEYRAACRVVAVKAGSDVPPKRQGVHPQQPLLQKPARCVAVELLQVTPQHALLATLPPAGAVQIDQRSERRLEVRLCHVVDRDR